ATRIDPELQHAARARKRAGNPTFALDLAGIADIDDHHVIAMRRRDRLLRAESFDLGIGFIEQGFDPAVNGLGHWSSLFSRRSCLVIPGRRKATNAESRSAYTISRFRIGPLRGTVRNDVRSISAPVPASPPPGPRS